MASRKPPDLKRALVRAVTKDEFDGVVRYAEYHCIRMPDTEEAFRGAVYKAIQELPDVSAEIKYLAAIKCMRLGMSPRIGGFCVGQVDSGTD